MREELRRFTDFDALAPAQLASIAEQVRRLRVPPRRWLLRPGRALAGRFYLLEGRVQLIEAGRSVIVGAGSARARRAVYPGPSAVETLAVSVFLNVDRAALDRVGPDADGMLAGVPEVLAEEASWQRRFLTSPLMARLDPVVWQRVLRAMTRVPAAPGDVVVHAGDRASACYVLCRGIAEIHDAARGLLAVLRPGSLFGEDALVSGAVRNASVVMCTAGDVASLPAACFREWLLDAVVQPLPGANGRCLIHLGPPHGGARWLPIADLRQAARKLSPELRYAIAGASYAERALAAFLLAEQGIDARPLGAAEVTPAPCGPVPTP